MMDSTLQCSVALPMLQQKHILEKRLPLQPVWSIKMEEMACA